MLDVEAFDQTSHGFVVRNLQQPIVETGVRLRDPEQVALGEARLHLADNRAQLSDLGIGDIPRRIAGRQALKEVIVAIQANNLLNVVNYGPPVGTVTSPQFGRSNAIGGGGFMGPGGSTNAVRRITLQMGFNF